MTQISEHFSLEELTFTEVRNAGPNTPPPAIVDVIEHVLAPGLEQVRALLGQPMHINSGYRSASVNAAVGGAATSAHVHGLAADFICPAFGDPLTVCRAIEKSGLKFDQLIFEYGNWTHVSFDPRMRRMVLSIERAGHYSAGLPSA